MRLTDVSLRNDHSPWYTCRFIVELVDVHDKVWADADLSKKWGVMPDFTSLGYIPGNPTKETHLRVWAHVVTMTGGYQTVNWKAELRWDNAIANLT
ncbi:hypothetical protein LK09_17010 [Microbacterium mangrovi]|uniref:Uncharacterized protein n=1 Tax=Microbacterium mangrovi TaxID=1348253 RepID=A0A0B2A2J4_9MICO|nr:hypothetical protein [Microbacterium mangrovi]KHK96049.1 hypothetical protein LK09_17010 [Microbacterium mangrovi]